MIKKYIVLMTDFGNDFYVGQMKGVIKSINPDAEILDLSHNIQPQNILQGMIIISRSYAYFPKESIFICVVDPEVGSKRDIIIVKLRNYLFIAPNNGILSEVIKNNVCKVYRLCNSTKYFLQPISNTFHGRDIISPIAAYISRGLKVGSVGELLEKKKLIYIDIPRVDIKFKGSKEYFIGKFLFADTFGNVVTNLKIEDLYKYDFEKYVIILKNRKKRYYIKYCKYYSEVPIGKILYCLNSYGFVEIAINGGSAYSFITKEFGKLDEICFEFVEGNENYKNKNK
ncbi:MAG: SAM-dependent chlorinase/fluorinase [Endomicrobia bacterium]|nr:SAM-dependent chlorinase/fluorinase [Endomicrobiia bacterium]